MMDGNLRLPCEKCGKLIDYDGVSGAGAKTVCEHCGSKKPHTLRGSPLLPFLFFFIVALAFALINPIGLTEDGMFFGCFGAFCLLLWLKVCLPYHIARLKDKLPGVPFFGFVSFLSLGFGTLSLFMFFVTKPKAYDPRSVTYFYKRIEGHEVTGGAGSIPKSKDRGREVIISFQKQVDFNIRLYRFDQAGELQFDSELSSKDSPHLDTFAGETWVVTNMDDKPLYYYVAGYRGARNIINHAVIPPPPENSIRSRPPHSRASKVP